MRKVILYIAMSLDGYIADINGKVDWLCGDGSDAQNIGSYDSFYKTIDTIIMGYSTYHQIVNELSPDNWVYNDRMTYVITHKQLPDKHNIVFRNNLHKLITELKLQDGKDIWICGGADVANQLIELGLIDRYHISVIPSILCDGIRLFRNKADAGLKLVSTNAYNGIVDLIYEHNF